MAGGGGGEEGEFGLQIAPMLDVMFVLLLFFMVSAGAVVKEGELGVQIPGQGKSSGTPQTPIILSIEKDGMVKFNGIAMDDPENPEIPSLRRRLKDLVEKSPDTTVVIAPEKEAVHKRVVHVIDACGYAKVTKLSFR